MALKKPLVLGSDGSIEQLQSGDELDIDLSGSSLSALVNPDELIQTAFDAVTISPRTT